MRIKRGRSFRQSASARRDAVAFITVGVFILFWVIALIPYAMSGSRKGSRPHWQCGSNLKETALAFILWANDNDRNVFPTELAAEGGGARDFVLAGDPVPVFKLLSNYMHSPKTLTCPVDKKRSRQIAKTFTELDRNGLGFFINADASVSRSNSVLLGDRNLGLSNQPIRPGLLTVTNPAQLQWLGPIHASAGGLAMADGSMLAAPQTGEFSAKVIFEESGIATNRLIIP